MQLYALSLFAFAVQASAATTLTLDIDNQTSITNYAAAIAKNLMSYYQPQDASQVGILPRPYYWWEAGSFFATMTNYWSLTNDTTYNDAISQAIASQMSPTNDFMMWSTQAFDLGNDDQAFWGLTAITAAERGLPVPEGIGHPASCWYDCAVNVFNDLASRWGNPDTCNGGLKWQFQNHTGYYYKSTITNAAFAQLAARLAAVSGNATYAIWADKTYNWLVNTQLVDTSSASQGYLVYDGAGDQNNDNCSQVSTKQWTYNAASLLSTTAVLSAFDTQIPGTNTTPAEWTSRSQGIWHGIRTYFTSPFPNATDVMYEWQCEKTNSCNTDELSFKSLLAQWSASAASYVEGMQDSWVNVTRATALAVASSCADAPTVNGSSNGIQCGRTWWTGAYDGVTGVGQQLNALEAVLALLA